MPKIVNFSGTATELNEPETDQLINAATNWHDPVNGRIVNHTNVTFPDESGGTFDVSFAIRLTDVAVDSVQTGIDNLASVIDNLPFTVESGGEELDTVDKIKGAIDVD